MLVGEDHPAAVALREDQRGGSRRGDATTSLYPPVREGGIDCWSSGEPRICRAYGNDRPTASDIEGNENGDQKGRAGESTIKRRRYSSS